MGNCYGNGFLRDKLRVYQVPNKNYYENCIGMKLKFGKFKFLLPEDSQIIFSPGPLIYRLRPLLKDFNKDDYLLCTGDPAIIGITCSLVSDITNGKYNLLKWDKQERKYYPVKINLHGTWQIYYKPIYKKARKLWQK